MNLFEGFFRSFQHNFSVLLKKRGEKTHTHICFWTALRYRLALQGLRNMWPGSCAHVGWCDWCGRCCGLLDNTKPRARFNPKLVWHLAGDESWTGCQAKPQYRNTWACKETSVLTRYILWAHSVCSTNLWTYTQGSEYMNKPLKKRFNFLYEFTCTSRIYESWRLTGNSDPWDVNWVSSFIFFFFQLMDARVEGGHSMPCIFYCKGAGFRACSRGGVSRCNQILDFSNVEWDIMYIYFCPTGGKLTPLLDLHRFILHLSRRFFWGVKPVKK